MARPLSKRVKANKTLVDKTKIYSVDEAFSILQSAQKAKFVESVEVAIGLGIDPRKSDQNVRSSVVLPNGTGQTVRVAVFAQGDAAEQATAAGADIVGFDDLADKIKAGDIDFDTLIATPDAMRVIGKLGPILGPRNLMLLKLLLMLKQVRYVSVLIRTELFTVVLVKLILPLIN